MTIVSIAVFLILMAIGIFIKNRLSNSSNRYLNPHEFLPDDEIHSLRQLYYLILMAFSFVIVLYEMIFWGMSLFYLALFDIFLSLHIAINLDKSSISHKILIILLIPFSSMEFILFHHIGVMYVDIVHIVIFLYFVKFYFDKFMEYTNSNGLGVAILLVFTIIFISFFVTQMAERVNPLDSLVMVSNAFTSNGYSVLGSSIPGKINSIFLVWGGYIISGAGTATLTAAILLKHFNKRVKQLERLIEEGGNENE